MEKKDFITKNADILSKPRIYVLNIHEVNDYRENQEDDGDSSIEFLEQLTEEQVQDIVADTNDDLSDVYSVEQFIAEFNWAVDDPISSDIHYLRYFN